MQASRARVNHWQLLPYIVSPQFAQPVRTHPTTQSAAKSFIMYSVLALGISTTPGIHPCTLQGQGKQNKTNKQVNNGNNIVRKTLGGCGSCWILRLGGQSNKSVAKTRDRSKGRYRCKNTDGRKGEI
jgi:hypothetical protein